MNEKKYIVSYQSGATGYGWEEKHDRLEQFEAFIDEMRHEYTACVTVWDNKLEDFIFWKDALCRTPKIDKLHSLVRDMRTKTREVKSRV